MKNLIRFSAGLKRWVVLLSMMSGLLLANCGRETDSSLESNSRPEPQSGPESGSSSLHVFRDRFTDGSSEGPEMVVLPPGSFTMGSPSTEIARRDNEGPQRTVRIAYQLSVGKYEVMVDEYRIFATDTGRNVSGGCTTRDRAGFRDTPSASWLSPGFSQAGNHPVTCVSWEDAQDYVTWLNQRTGLADRADRYRLLSEAEWEYAARAGTTGRFSNDGGEAELCQIANGADQSTGFSWRNTACSDGYRKRTAPVGGFRENAFGLHDMHGNVFEWVEDCGSDDYIGAPSDGSASTSSDCSNRVFRGGSWDSPPAGLRAALRFEVAPGGRNYTLGFRLARTLPP